MPGAEPLNEPDVPFVRFFLAEQAIGFILLSAVLLTVIFSPRVRRNGPWINFVVACIVYSFSYLLLALAGQQTGSSPPFGICLAQASFIYAAPPLVASASLALILQLSFDLRASSPPESHPRQTLALLVSPYLIYLTIFFQALALGLKDRSGVVRASSDIYCVIHHGAPGRTSAALVGLALLAGLVFQALIGIGLFKAHSHLGRARGLDGALGALRSMMVRVGVFTLVVIVVVGIACAFFFHKHKSHVPNGVIGAMPLVVFFIFGTQRDIFTTWMFWRQDEEATVEQAAKYVEGV